MQNSRFYYLQLGVRRGWGDPSLFWLWIMAIYVCLWPVHVDLFLFLLRSLASPLPFTVFLLSFLIVGELLLIPILLLLIYSLVQYTGTVHATSPLIENIPSFLLTSLESIRHASNSSINFRPGGNIHCGANPLRPCLRLLRRHGWLPRESEQAHRQAQGSHGLLDDVRRV